MKILIISVLVIISIITTTVIVRFGPTITKTLIPSNSRVYHSIDRRPPDYHHSSISVVPTSPNIITYNLTDNSINQELEVWPASLDSDFSAAFDKPTNKYHSVVKQLLSKTGSLPVNKQNNKTNIIYDVDENYKTNVTTTLTSRSDTRYKTQSVFLKLIIID